MGGEGDSSEATTVGVGAPAETGEELATVNVRCSNGSKFSVQTALGSTVGAFKAMVAKNCDVPADQQRLIYKGRILKDDQTLESYGLQADHTVHMVRGFTASATTTTPITGNPTTNDAPVNAVRSVPANEAGGLGGAGLGASLFPGPGLDGLSGNGGSALFGAGFPEFEQVQLQLSQNPNMMQEFMNMPAMQSLTSNPDLMRSLIMGNPQMREIMDRNPELAHILNDPSILRQTLETARNPELVREMMRSTDRAMSSIESSPEGFNMLRRMYENVQEPFLNATMMAGDTENNLSSNPFAALLGNQGGGQQRNGSNNLSTTGSDPNADTIPNTNPLPNPWTPSGRTQTNSTPRSNHLGDIRPPSLGGVSGLGGRLPELDHMLLGGVAQNSAHFTQLLQNPAISQMMQSLLSNPQYMNQILNMSPQLRAISEMNPQFREMMQNPDTLRQLSLQQMLTLQQTLMSQLNRQTNQVPSQTGDITGNTNTNNMNLEMLMNMLGGLGTGSGLGVLANPNVPPEELYATQLSQLQEMGFFDTQENIRALQATRGNVNAAVERLLNPGL